MNAQASHVGTQARPALEIEHKTTLAVFALVAGVLTLLVGVAAAVLASKTFVPAERFYAIYKANEGTFTLVAIAALVWSVFSIPFVVGLGTLLRAKSSTLALAATILSSAGILLLGFTTTLLMGAFGALVLAPNARAASDQAAFWFTFGAAVSGVPQAALGLGMVLFGWLAWRSRVLPDWLAVVATIGGVAALVSPALPGPFAWNGFYLTAFFVVSATTGIVLLQSRGR